MLSGICYHSEFEVVHDIIEVVHDINSTRNLEIKAIEISEIKLSANKQVLIGLHICRKSVFS